MTTCIFLGHREVYHSHIEVRLNTEIEKLLQTDSEFQFLTGGMGQFDAMGAGAVRLAKRQHMEKHITLILVLPYLSSQLNANIEYYHSHYDQIIIPKELDTVHYKAAIQVRNRWMADQADIVISYICRDFGGAFTSVRYAQREGKSIINLAEKIQY